MKKLIQERITITYPIEEGQDKDKILQDKIKSFNNSNKDFMLSKDNIVNNFNFVGNLILKTFHMKLNSIKIDNYFSRPARQVIDNGSMFIFREFNCMKSKDIIIVSITLDANDYILMNDDLYIRGKNIDIIIDLMNKEQTNQTHSYTLNKEQESRLYFFKQAVNKELDIFADTLKKNNINLRII